MEVELDRRTSEEINEARLARDIRSLLDQFKGGYTVIDFENHAGIGTVIKLVGPMCEPYVLTIKALPKTAHEPLEEQ